MTSNSDLSNEDDTPYWNHKPYEDNAFHWNYIISNDILKAFAKTKSNAIGSDGISLRMIRMLLPYILPIIEHIFNFSLMNEVFPAT